MTQAIMTDGREKRLLLGWLALLAPLPLPFNTVLEWPALFVYCVLVLVFLQRSDAGKHEGLPNWALNILGAVYLPLFLLDVRWAVIRNSPVKALLHLIMFLVIVKLFSIRREKDKWHVIIAIFFIFIGAMATSSHVTISLYLLAFMLLSLLVLARLAHLHVVSNLGQDHSTAQRPAVSTGRPLWIGSLLIIAVAVPLFASMPRVREPFILGRGGMGIGRTTGFSDSVDLGVTSRIRGNRNVAMRLQFDEPPVDASEMRFKGATFEYYQNRRWFRELRPTRNLFKRRDGAYVMDADPPGVPRDGPGDGLTRNAVIYLEPIGSNSLVLPVETRALRLESGNPVVDPGGAVLLPEFRRQETLRFEVELDSEPVIVGAQGDERLTALKLGDEVTPQVRELAGQLMGEGSPEERVDRLLNALLTDYLYTDDFTGRDGVNPLEDFLFVYKSGHCEYFASAMVLMLRAEGIPARFVTGFMGAELNPLESYYVVRQQNAHAWVEAMTPERGWQVYDPTPPEGRPGVSPQSLGLFFRQVGDFFMFRWDRWVLTYGADDQKSLLKRLRERLAEWWTRFNEERDEEPLEVEGVVVAPGETLPEVEATWRPKAYQIVLFVVLSAAAIAWIVYRRRRRWTAARSYVWLRRLLARSSPEVDPTIVPLRLQELALARYPGAASEIQGLVGHYLRESFAGQSLSPDDLDQLAAAQRSIWQAEKVARRRERRQRRQRKPSSGVGQTAL